LWFLAHKDSPDSYSGDKGRPRKFARGRTAKLCGEVVKERIGGLYERELVKLAKDETGKSVSCFQKFSLKD
jgi:hypothetical protein